MKYFPFAIYRFELISRITSFHFVSFSKITESPLRDNNKTTSMFSIDLRGNEISFQFLKQSEWQKSTNCRPNQNIMKKVRKKPNWQIKLKCAGCEEMCNDNVSVYTCYITYCCICWAIDKQLYLYLIAMGHIEGVFVSWKLRRAREWRCHTFLYLSSSHAVWTNAGGNFLTMFDKLTVLQEATIQK